MALAVITVLGIRAIYGKKFLQGNWPAGLDLGFIMIVCFYHAAWNADAVLR